MLEWKEGGGWVGEKHDKNFGKVCHMWGRREGGKEGGREARCACGLCSREMKEGGGREGRQKTQKTALSLSVLYWYYYNSL